MSIYDDLSVGDALTRLAAARGGVMDDIQSEVYLDRLERFDPVFVARACAHWSDIPRADYETLLPDVGKLIETIDRLTKEDREQTARARLLPLPKGRDGEPPPPFCAHCRDEPYNWRVFRCAGRGPSAGMVHGEGEVYACGRRKDHAAHTYVEKCGCHATNPVSAEHRRRLDEFNQKREKKTSMR